MSAAIPIITAGMKATKSINNTVRSANDYKNNIYMSEVENFKSQAALNQTKYIKELSKDEITELEDKSRYDIATLKNHAAKNNLSATGDYLFNMANDYNYKLNKKLAALKKKSNFELSNYYNQAALHNANYRNLKKNAGFNLATDILSGLS